MPSLTNVIAYSAQLGALAIAALLATHALRLRAPLAALRFWQAILAASLALPWLQPRATDPATETSSAAMTSSMSAFLMDAAVSRRHDIAEWVLIIVLTGSALRLLWLAIGMLRLRSITRHASLDRSLDDMLCELSSSLGTKASIAISDAIQSPSTVGVRRPLILLPPRVLEMSPPVQRAVIAHELVHVRRRDWLHTIAEEIWCALLWFHPAARLIASRLALARETLVDQTTILLTRDRRSYAEALLAFSNPQRGTPAARFGRGMETYLPGVTPLIGRRQLSQRISLIAQEDVMSRARLGVSFAVALLIAGAATASAINALPITRDVAQASRVYTAEDGVVLPKTSHEVKPTYTAAAMQQKIQGSVIMSVVVLDSGDVGSITILHSLDEEYGLDQQAVDAMQQWKFTPGKKDGKPVAVQITVQMTFTLR